ncbi:long-chain-alcohol O-fatty-acyltransferase-like [Rosa rugosa]|uniref:long-chain-alcohol O-fatty-acyltransferase-like n=1 Tax=Rosa rugosa TaxID=74645 RepID=UPI002B40FC15|nr:long-chain-alcohol O-fatty-acyltransferase-like [Rosa rugosa]
MDGDEIKNFIKVWIIAIASQCYCYYVAARIPTKSMMRLISILPILYLLLMLPLNLHSIHLGAPSAFFLGCLAIFKLLLFSFDSGPLSPPPKGLLPFISIALLPINIKRLPKRPRYGYTITKLVPNKTALWALKALLLGEIIHVRKDYRQNLHPYVLTSLSLSHLYLGLEIGFALSVALPQAMFGFELEPHFNEPYFSTSLQDFWGRRWNLAVSNTLRPLVYHPIRRISTGKSGATYEPIDTSKPPRAPVLPVISAFTISGLMHELFFYYVTRARPTGEMMCFFVLQGVCLAIELEVKKALAHRVRFHPLVSGLLTLVFLIATTDWLLFPHIIRTGADAKSLEECAIMVDFVKANISPLYYWQKS